MYRHLRVVAQLAIGLRLLRILVEQACVTHTSSDWRNVGCVNILPGKALPGDFCEPRVLHDVLASAVKIAKSLGQVVCDELAEEILRIRVYVWWVLDPASEDVLVDFQRTAGIPKGSETAQHLEYQNAQRPPATTS